MTVEEHAPLAPRTTLGVGGSARYLIRASTIGMIEEAICFARERMLPMTVLGAGSNVLISDEGIDGVVVQNTCKEMVWHETPRGARVTADAGVSWDVLVDAAAERDLYGIEYLAGIPGTVGGAVVQNIGAYGSVLADTFVEAEVIDSATDERTVVTCADAAFGYRTSYFKRARTAVILRVTLELSSSDTPRELYSDLAHAREAGVPLERVRERVEAVRAIRTRKFPHAATEGCAGSFFKNPVIDAARAQELERTYPGLPRYDQPDGRVKIALGWLLDHGLGLRGFTRGAVRLYEQQALVIVAAAGATARDIDAFAREIEERVQRATGIAIEREVETLGIIA